ncbi:hypothetical protein OESDEN_13724 [Oesophagostomum dentatum]|uniref:Uncharacterized protein n=1 Tax=Oesophagostomum dentatum TaxID=61180 RepID=A0A0B1SNK4_OESDE|nr:hypothetical protein OESDEN_13724 [Oesophagostomum dentatum]
MGNAKLDETARCCYHDGCNLAIYKYLTALPKDVSQQGFVDSKECEEVVETTHASSSTANVDVVTETSSSDMNTVAEASTETREDSTVESTDSSASGTVDSTEASTTESSVTETSPDEEG